MTASDTEENGFLVVGIGEEGKSCGVIMEEDWEEGIAAAADGVGIVGRDATWGCLRAS